MHFEDIWNAAEQLGEQREDAAEIALSQLRATVDKLQSVDNLSSRQAELIGEALFDLCQITRHFNINSAAALRWAIENRKAELLDPERPEDVP
jgi:hypothetical protein